MVGMLIGLLALLLGGSVRFNAGCLEFFGGPLGSWFRRIPGGQVAFTAMTLGHVIIGRDRATLDEACVHERVHVRQYERWGPFFVPAYLLASAFLWLRGRRPYWDNPFEIEAYQAERDLQ